MNVTTNTADQEGSKQQLQMLTVLEVMATVLAVTTPTSVAILPDTTANTGSGVMFS